MSSAKPRPRWRFLFTPPWLAWHAFAVLAAWGMLWLGDWQFHRAEGGNALSWAYTFEWPIFVILGVIFWGKTIADEFKTRKAADQAVSSADIVPGAVAAGVSLPATAYTAASEDVFDDEEDPELAAYNAYLAGLSSGHKLGRYGSPAGSGQPGSTQPMAG